MIDKWNPGVATDVFGLQDILHIAGSTIKAQVIASPVLSSSALAKIRTRLDAVAGELQAIQVDLTSDFGLATMSNAMKAVEAFNSLCVPSTDKNAVQELLRNWGLTSSDSAAALSEAIDQGLLIMTGSLGMVRKP